MASYFMFSLDQIMMKKYMELYHKLDLILIWVLLILKNQMLELMKL